MSDTNDFKTICEVEEALVSSLLLNENAIFDVFPILKKEMFCTSELAFIYEAICSLNSQGMKVDMILVEIEMRKLNEELFGQMNGLAFIATAMPQVRHVANIKRYAEEVKRQYMLRLLGTFFGMMQGKAAQFEAAYLDLINEEYQSLSLYFDYTPSNTVENIRAQVLLQLKKGMCDLIIVDYINVLEASRRPGETQEQVISRLVKALKQLANETDRPVLVVSQLNRKCEDRADRAHTPSLHDFRDSGSIEQVADCAFFVYRPERHGITHDEVTGESLHQVGELFILKTRNGGTGVARYRYNDSYTRLTNYRKSARP